MVTVAGVIANNVPRRRHDICFSRVGGWGGLVRLGSWAASSGRGEGSCIYSLSISGMGESRGNQITKYHRRPIAPESANSEAEL